MKNEKLANIISLVVIPALLVLFGIILLVNPDSASRLIASVVGWVLMAVGVMYAIGTITGSRSGADGQSTAKSGTAAAVAIILGAFLTARPLALAAVIGCIVGLGLLLQGIRQLRIQKNPGSIMTTVAGVLLILLPMTTSRIVFRLCGVAMIVFGGLSLYANFRSKNHLNPPDDGIFDV